MQVIILDRVVVVVDMLGFLKFFKVVICISGQERADQND